MLHSFVVLVCGTLVYGKGDELEQKKEYEVLVADSEAPSSTSAPPSAAPGFAPVPDGAMQTAPMGIAMPSSFKVQPSPCACVQSRAQPASCFPYDVLNPDVIPLL